MCCINELALTYNYMRLFLLAVIPYFTRNSLLLEAVAGLTSL